MPPTGRLGPLSRNPGAPLGGVPWPPQLASCRPQRVSSSPPNHRQELVAGTSVNEQQAAGESGADSLTFVDEEALTEPGVKEAQQKFVKDAAGVKWLYQWACAQLASNPPTRLVGRPIGGSPRSAGCASAQGGDAVVGEDRRDHGPGQQRRLAR